MLLPGVCACGVCARLCVFSEFEVFQALRLLPEVQVVQKMVEAGEESITSLQRIGSDSFFYSLSLSLLCIYIYIYTYTHKLIMSIYLYTHLNLDPIHVHCNKGIAMPFEHCHTQMPQKNSAEPV